MDDGAWEIQPALTPPSITISSTLFLVWITDINENKLNKYRILTFIYLLLMRLNDYYISCDNLLHVFYPNINK